MISQYKSSSVNKLIITGLDYVGNQLIYYTYVQFSNTNQLSNVVVFRNVGIYSVSIEPVVTGHYHQNNYKINDKLYDDPLHRFS